MLVIATSGLSRQVHLFTILSPDILSIAPHSYRNDRIRVESLSDQPVHFLGIVSPVQDMTLGFSQAMTFFKENRCVAGFMDAIFSDHESGDKLLIGIDSNRGF